MAQTCEIKFEDVSVGTAQVQKQGLYLSFSCRCRLPLEGLYRIHVICGEKREDLGICVPLDDAFGMDKKIPAKRFGEGELSFKLVPKDWTQPEVTLTEPNVAAEEKISAPEEEQDFCAELSQQFIPVSEDEPFEYLDKLENAHMEICDGEPGVVINETTEE